MTPFNPYWLNRTALLEKYGREMRKNQAIERVPDELAKAHTVRFQTFPIVQEALK